MAAPPAISVTISEVPIEIAVYFDAERRVERVSDLDGLNKFDAITRIKEQLVPECYDSTPHKCWLEFNADYQRVSLPCSHGRFFDECFNQFLERRGQNLCFHADFRSPARKAHSRDVQKKIERLLKHKNNRTMNFKHTHCLFEGTLQIILFEGRQMLGKLAQEDYVLAERIHRQPVLVDNIRENGKRLLALLILVLADKEHSLGQTFLDFWDQGYRDDLMPFAWNDRPTFCDEDIWELIRRFQDQLTVAELRSLKDDNRFHDFEDTQPLPFSRMDPIKKKGGFGDIFEIELLSQNPELYRLVWSETGKEKSTSNPPLALKKLNERSGRTPDDFKQETSILVRLAGIEHPHIVRLITAFRHGDHYYLVFPLAKFCLERLFEETEPEKSLKHIHWIIGQMAGVARALNAIHSQMTGSSQHPLRPTQRPHRVNHQLLGVPQSTPGTNALSLRDDKLAKSGELLKGVHNDLAPGNLLIFDKLDVKLEGDEAKYGRIVISDFGLAKLRRHIDGSKSFNIRGQPNFLAPESKAENSGGRYQDQTKDIWCMGAILLLILVWLEGGRCVLTAFDTARSGTTNSGCEDMTDQGFWTYSQTEKCKKLRPAVIEQMHRLPHATNWLHRPKPGDTERVQKAVHGVIALVQRCFNFEASKRPTAKDLNAELQRIYDQLVATN